MSADTAEKNAQMVMKLIEKLPDGRREKVKAMFEGPVGLAYFTAPASSRESFHLCFPGGLAEHSLNVVKNLFKLADALVPGRYSREELIFVALFHDLGKVGDGNEEHYVKVEERYKIQRGELYEINKKCAWMPTAERSLYILQRYGIEVSVDEYRAIRLNDGQYEETNKPYRSKEPELALLLHWADHWSSRQEKHEAGFSPA